MSTDVCARLVEILSGLTFDRYLQANVFDPLGMADSGFWVPEESMDRFAACYRYRHAAPPELMDDPAESGYRRQRSYLSGAGGLVSTSGTSCVSARCSSAEANSVGAASSGARRSS